MIDLTGIPMIPEKDRPALTLTQEEVNELASVLAYDFIPNDKPLAKAAVGRIVDAAKINLTRPYRNPNE